MAFGRYYSPHLSPVAHVARALRLVASRPTAHGARSAQRELGVIVLWADAGRALPHVVGRGSTAPTPLQVGGTAFKSSYLMRSNTMARVARALRLVENRPTAHGARAEQRGFGDWGVCVVGQRGARSLPRRRPGLDRINTATGRRNGSRKFLFTAFESHGAHRARFSPRGETADRPRSTCALADLEWLSSRPSRNGLHPRRWPGLDRTTTATGRRHGLRQVTVTASNPVRRVARALRPVENRRTAHGARTA